MTRETFTRKILVDQFKIAEPEARIHPNGVIFVSPGLKFVVNVSLELVSQQQFIIYFRYCWC